MARPRPTVLVLNGRSDRGGGPANVYRLLASIDREHFRFVVACPDEEPYFARLRALDGVDVHEFPLRRFTPTQAPGIVTRLAALVRRDRVGIVHSHGKAAGLWSRALKGVCPGLSVVHHFRGLHYGDYGATKRAAYFAAERLQGLLTNVLVHVSESERRDALRVGLASADRQVVIPNGVETPPIPDRAAREAARKRLGLPTDGFTVATVARLSAMKGLDVAAAAIGHARAAGAALTWTLVGGAEDFGPERVREWLRSHGAESHAVLAGDRDDVRDWLCAADAYLSTSRWEGLPTAVLEAQAAALPVVATDVVGNEEVVDEEVGILVPAGDAQAAGNALARLAADPALRRRLGRAGAKRVAAHYSIARMVAAHEQLYQRLLERRTGPGAS